MKRLNLIVWKYWSILQNPTHVREPQTLRVERFKDLPKPGELFVLQGVNPTTGENSGRNWLCCCDSVHAVALRVDDGRASCFAPVFDSSEHEDSDCAALISYKALCEFKAQDLTEPTT